MAYYRIYVFEGGLGRIVTAEEIEADSDDEALKAASEIYHRFRREIWRGDRHVGTIEISTPSPDQPYV